MPPPVGHRQAQQRHAQPHAVHDGRGEVLGRAPGRRAGGGGATRVVNNHCPVQMRGLATASSLRPRFPKAKRGRQRRRPASGVTLTCSVGGTKLALCCQELDTGYTDLKCLDF